MWNEGLIVLDTNALLNLFRYTESTRAEFLTVLQAIAEQLWIPHQIALEFQRRRLDVIDDQSKAYDDLDKAIEAGKNGVGKALQGFRHHPLLNKSAITDILDQGMQLVSEAVAKSRKEYKSRVVASDENEAVFDAISALYTLRVGLPFDAETLDALYAEGAIRYESKLPPGYADKSKPEPDRYGDLVLWRQLLDYIGAEKRPVLFVTDDGKEDWWRQAKGKTYGPRVELVDEFYEVSGERVHFYAPERFLEFAKKKLSIAVSENSLMEVEEVSRHRPRRDVNALFAQRSRLQSERNELQKTLAYRSHGGVTGRAEIEELSARLVSIESELDELKSQREFAEHGLEGLREGSVRSSIRAHLARTEMEIEQLTLEYAALLEQREGLSRNHAAILRGAEDTTVLQRRLSAIISEVELIDHLINSEH